MEPKLPREAEGENHLQPPQNMELYVNFKRNNFDTDNEIERVCFGMEINRARKMISLTLLSSNQIFHSVLSVMSLLIFMS